MASAMADSDTPEERLIAHLDMDAFYASVELLRYPELRGQAVAIGGGRRHAPRESLDPATGKITRTFSTLAQYAGRGVITRGVITRRGEHAHVGERGRRRRSP